MVELTEAEKVEMINRRLKQYSTQKYNLEIDLAAFTAANDQQSVARVQSEMIKMDNVYAAVKALLPENIQKGAVSATTASNS